MGSQRRFENIYGKSNRMIIIEETKNGQCQDIMGLGRITHLLREKNTKIVLAVIGIENGIKRVYIKQVVDIDTLTHLAQASQYIV